MIHPSTASITSIALVLLLGAITQVPSFSEAVRLYLVRHGDPEYVDLFTGLTDHGRAESKALAPHLASLGITHAYTSPMQRAKLTAQLALEDIPKFSALNRNNFEENVGIQDWCAEKQEWQAADTKLEQALLIGTVLWDLPVPLIRNQLADIVNGTLKSSPGWVKKSPNHGEWIDYYNSFCHDADEFLARHGIVRNGPNYRMSAQDASNPEKRDAQIVIFGHGGTWLILLAHLLQIPLPMVTASMWLPPSSVTTILFEEYTKQEAGSTLPSEDEESCRNQEDCSTEDDGSLILTPRAIGIGGISHLSKAGLGVALSKYEQGKRPSGLKRNYW